MSLSVPMPSKTNPLVKPVCTLPHAARHICSPSVRPYLSSAHRRFGRRGGAATLAAPAGSAAGAAAADGSAQLAIYLRPGARRPRTLAAAVDARCILPSLRLRLRLRLRLPPASPIDFGERCPVSSTFNPFRSRTIALRRHALHVYTLVINTGTAHSVKSHFSTQN